MSSASLFPEMSKKGHKGAGWRLFLLSALLNKVNQRHFFVVLVDLL